MKKIFTLIAVAALAMTMVACGNNNKKANADTETAVETEKAAPAAAGKSTLDKYADLIEKAIEVYPKVKAGDAGAVAEYTKIAEDMAALSTELSGAMATMSTEDVERFTKLGEKWAAALQ